MGDREFLHVDPAELHLPNSRRQGADPGKLHRQIAKYGRTAEGMPPVLVSRGIDGELMINDGVTRATRLAKIAPGELIVVEVIDELPGPVSRLPKVGEKL